MPETTERRLSQAGGAPDNFTSPAASITGWSDHREPRRSPSAAQIAAVFEYADQVAAEMRVRFDYWRDGFAAGERAHADDYSKGFAAGVAFVKGIEHQLVRALDARRTLWIVRGQRRTRETFGQPHQRDYPGRGEAA